MTPIITHFPRGLCLSPRVAAESANSNAPCGHRVPAHTSAAKLSRRPRRVYPLPIGTVNGLGRRRWLLEAAGMLLCAAVLVLAWLVLN